ncbi:MAG: hypothetical protein WKG00_01285 [Polyangiaceae bacterium]
MKSTEHASSGMGMGMVMQFSASPAKVVQRTCSRVKSSGWLSGSATTNWNAQRSETSLSSVICGSPSTTKATRGAMVLAHGSSGSTGSAAPP